VIDTVTDEVVRGPVDEDTGISVVVPVAVIIVLRLEAFEIEVSTLGVS
jgi:hypothetical protein